MKLSQAIREGRKRVEGQSFGSFFAWDARRPRWQIDKHPPNTACAVGMALLAVGWRPDPRSRGWTPVLASMAAGERWPMPAISLATELNDGEHMRWDRIAARLEKEGY